MKFIWFQLEDQYPQMASFFKEANNNPFGFPLELLIKKKEEKWTFALPSNKKILFLK